MRHRKMNRVGDIINEFELIRWEKPRWHVKCPACSQIKGMYLQAVRKRKSCGCKGLSHGHANGYKVTRTYQTWLSMRRRCDPRYSPSPRYIELGIQVCERWVNSFENFLADMGERPDGMTIDRINNDGHYTQENCRWATWAQQVANKKPRQGQMVDTPNGPLKYSDIAKLFGVTHGAVKYWVASRQFDEQWAKRSEDGFSRGIDFNGKCQSLRAHAADSGVKYTTALARWNRNWSIEETLKTPVGNNGPKARPQ